MKKKEYTPGSYGAYLVQLIKSKNLTQEEFRNNLKVSKTYLVDVFNGRLKPPTPEMQEKIVNILKLTDVEKTEFYNKSAEGRKEIPKDIFDYLTNNPDELIKLRERMRV